MRIAIIIIDGATDDGFITGLIQLQNGMGGSDERFELIPSCLLKKIDEIQEEDYLLVSNEPLILETISLYNEREHFTKKRNSNMEKILDWWVD